MSCNSYCDCGCNKNISYGCNKTCNQSYSGIYFCKDPFCYVKTNFVMPDDNVVLEIEVTDSDLLYVGQGVRIGAGFVQIAAIEDSTNISIVHNGTATPNLQITAVQPSYGCYQYPLIPVGAVDQLIIPTIAGLDGSFVVVVGAISDPVAQLTYGYNGPAEVEFEVEIVTEIANTPRYIEVQLPVAVISGAPNATFSAMIDDGAGFVPAIAYRRGNTVVIALDAATDLSDGSDRKFRVSGVYGLQ